MLTDMASWDLDKNRILVCKQAEEAKDFITNLKEEAYPGPNYGIIEQKLRRTRKL